MHAIVGSIGGRATTLLAPFLVMPAMLDHVGPRDFGVWMTAVAVTNVAQFADLGIGNGLLTRLSGAFARADNEAVRRDIASSYAVLSAIAFPLVITGLLLMAGQGPLVSPIYGATLLAFGVSIPATIIQRVLYASQQVMLANIWQIVAAVLAVASAFAAIALEWSAASIVLTYALASPVTMVLAALATFFQRPSIAPRIRDISRRSARALMGLGSRFLLLAVLTATAASADNILIAVQLSEEEVTEYAVPARIGFLLTLVVSTMMMPLWPSYGDALARGDHEWVWDNARKMAFIGLGSVLLVGATLTLFIDPILIVWMGRDFGNAEWIIGGMAVFAAVTAITAPFNMVLNSAGRVSSQIGAWMVLLTLAVTTKWIALPIAGIWVLPFIDAVIYAFAISPLMIHIAWRVAGTKQIGKEVLP
jgi:O-antigen/teichoic acid export membrane protein